MQLQIVTYSAPGYAREDDSTPAVMGAYTDPLIAAKVARVNGFSRVDAIEVGFIPAGIIAFAKEIGSSLESKDGDGLYVVTHSRPGFAREDAGTPAALGAYTDHSLAKRIATLNSGSQVHRVEIDVIPPGILARAKELSMPFGSS